MKSTAEATKIKPNNFIKKILLKIQASLGVYPKKITVIVNKVIGKIRGISVIIPNPKLPNYYIFREMFNEDSTIIDVGCGFDADLSVYMIKKYGLKSVGIDPTLKHQLSLASLSKKSQGHFIHKLWAISATNGKITFNESKNSVSGSILNDHKNLQNNNVKTYEVESVNMSRLPISLGLEKIQFIKLDIEGAEYDLIDHLEKDDLIKYDQIFIEFHHHAIPKYSKKDTLNRANKIKSFGFKSFTLNNHDFLFYR